MSLCETCDAACCAASQLEYEFSGEEAKFLDEDGSVMVKTANGRFKLVKCSGLVGNLCKYETTGLKPKCCKSLEVGGKICQELRSLEI